MKKERFRLIEGHALTWKDRIVDLHNNFDFDQFSYSVKDSRVSLSWCRCKGHWVSDDDPAAIKVIFTGVYFLMIESNACDESIDPSTLDFAGYLSVEDVMVMNGFLELDEVRGNYHYIFGFEGGMKIKIGAASGYVETNDTEHR